MGFWSKISDFAKNPLGENSGVAKTLAPVVQLARKTAPDAVDTRFVGIAARGTKAAGEKFNAPLIQKDPVLTRQVADTSGDPAAPSGTQMQHKLGAAATIAATVYGAGALGGSGGEAGAVNSFDSGAMAEAVGYSSPGWTGTAAAGAGAGNWLTSGGQLASTIKNVAGIAGTLGALGKPAGNPPPAADPYLPISQGQPLPDAERDSQEIALMALGGAALAFILYKV